ncbi:MAG: ankyrin repeat domain-containing protein [Verrucomicrobiota bacterium]
MSKDPRLAIFKKNGDSTCAPNIMFFLIGLFLGALSGAIAQVAIGVTLLFLRGFGLLWGDRRLWWSLAAFFAILIGRYFVSASNRHEDVSDQLQKGFIFYQNTGVAIGSVLVWLIGLLILWKVGSGWKEPISGLAPTVSVVALIALSISAFVLKQRPAEVREVRAEKQAAWENAIQERNLASVGEFVDSGTAIWSHSSGLPSGPIFHAVRNHDAEFVLALIDLHPRRPDAQTSAMDAAVGGDHREMLKGILTGSPAEQQPAMIAQAIWLSIGNGNRPLYDWLFSEFDADPNQLPIKGTSLLMAAARTGRVDLAEDLLGRGADLEYLHPGGRLVAENALGQAIHFDEMEMLQFLLEAGADPNGGKEGSYTLLMRAIDQKNREMVPFLLEAGADPNAADNDGFTALHVAARGSKPNLEVAKQLVDAGADPNLANGSGFRPITKLPKEWFD